ncbi:hypothetical protein [Arthrobacter sp. UYCo732]|uniref:hypothetical protein n=1 Tax=Arthrobacter sp. UYCo732 TaxID=3156336 RepID=UPI0033997F63
MKPSPRRKKDPHRRARRLPSAATALRSTAGAFDLPSILVGVVIVGVLTAGVLVSVLGVIPFSQDLESKQDLAALTTAEGVSKVRDGVFRDKAGLKGATLLNGGDTLAVGTDANGSCFAGISKSETGRLFFNSDTAPTPKELTDHAALECVTDTVAQDMIAGIGGHAL